MFQWERRGLEEEEEEEEEEGMSCLTVFSSICFIV
jgi:hypothetical protein